MGNFSGRVSTSLTFRVPTTRPKVFNATLQHLSVARGHSRRPSREQNAPSCSRDILGRLSREQNAPSRSRDILGRLFREQNAPSRSRDNLGAVVRYRNSTGTLQELYGDSTGTLRALLDAAEVRPEPVRLIERLGAFRDGDLDG